MRPVKAICLEWLKSFAICNVGFPLPSWVVWKTHCAAGPWRDKGTFLENQNLHLLDYLQ